ncbi:MAG: transketolase family protein, partial [Candidatus Asgardarchaeia archaeon]
MDLRDAFFDRLYDLVKDDDNFYFLTADMWAFSLSKFKEKLGRRFINVGVAEQNMISVAAGLAKAGKKVCVYTITPFVTERCFEQIKIDLCCMNLPVTIIGIGAGLTFSNDGPTHHSLNDIAIMRTLPNLTIYSPSGPVMNSYVAQKAYENDGPTYIRLDKGDYSPLPEYDNFIFPEPNKDSVPFSLGICGPYGKPDVVIFSTGTNMYDVIEAAEYLTHKEGVFTT